jgi:hypothetical protein
VGAIIGAIAGYMFFTDRGRALRRHLEPAIEDLRNELVSFGGTVRRATGAASDGWRMIDDVLRDKPESSRYSQPEQTSPF